MLQKTIKILLAICCLLSLSAPPALAVGEEGALPTRLRFVNSLDATVYSERLVYEVFSRLGIDVSVTLTDMGSALDGVNLGIFDGICNQVEGVEADFPNLIAVPLETSRAQTYAVALKDDPRRIHSQEDLKGRRVGGLAGNVRLQNTLNEAGVSYTEETTMTELYDALRSGKCDLIILSDTSTREENQLVLPGDMKVAGLLSAGSCHIYLNEKYEDLLGPIQETLKTMEEDGSLDRIQAMKPLRDRAQKSVLFLSSYSSEMVWEQWLTQGVSNIFDQYDGIGFRNIPLNTYQIPDATLRDHTALSAITANFIHSPPDAVLVSDNEALRFLMNNYNAVLPNDIPVVFCGLDGGDEDIQWRENGNVFGLLDHISAQETVGEMLALFPETERILVINDYSLTGRRWQKEIESQLAPYADQVEISYNRNVTFHTLLNQVASLPENTLILCGSYFQDGEARYYSQAEVQMRLNAASPVPLFGLLDSSQGFGQLGGKYNNAQGQGEAAAKLLVEALETENFHPAEAALPPEDNIWIFDWKVMAQYGIRESQLPQGAVILNDVPTLREADPVFFTFIVVGACASAVIITLLAGFAHALGKRNRLLALAGNDLRRSQEQILAVKNRLQTTLETAPIAYSLMVDDVVVDCNRNYRENLGFTPGAKNVSKYPPGKGYERYIEECKEKGALYNINWRTIEKNGQARRYLYSLATTQYNGKEAVVLWGYEVESLERQKDMLKKANEELLAVIESTPLPIALLSPTDHRFLVANPSWRDLFRVPPEVSLEELTWKDGPVLTQKSLGELMREALATDEVVQREWEFETYGGEPLEIEAYLKRIFFDGKACLVITHRDLRQEKAKERMLESAAEKEREANRLKSHFLMNMSHEIRTPLNAIIGTTQIAKSTDGPEKLLESIAHIGRSAAVLLGVVNQVLDLSLIEEGKMTLKPEPAKLSEIVAGVETVMEMEGMQKGLKGSVTLENIKHDDICVDPVRLQQVLMALGSNGVKFTPPGGEVSLTVRETAVEGDLVHFLFAVRDTGVGIEEGKLGRLFKPFEQGDDSITRQHGGAGLGLSVAKSIVEMMGGEIYLESEVGKGSVFFFTITVPYLEAEAPVEAEKLAEEEGPKKTLDFSALRVLVVDDVEMNRLVATELLMELGVATEEAENGRQAVEMVAANPPGYYDLIFMDVQMPVLDGCSAVREIRALPREDVKTLPISGMTANTMPDDVTMMMEAGMNGYVGKPVFFEDIVERMERLL